MEKVHVNGVVIADMSEEVLALLPCGCFECSGGVKPGHFACSEVSDQMLIAEDRGAAVRVYDNGRWQWVKTGR